MRFNELSTERTIIDESHPERMLEAPVSADSAAKFVSKAWNKVKPNNPVGAGERAKNWIKSKTFGDTKDMGQAEQLKSAEANRLWRTMKTSGVGIDGVDIEDFQEFLINMGYGRSGKEILKKFAQEKRGAEPAPEAETPAPEASGDAELSLADDDLADTSRSASRSADFSSKKYLGNLLNEAQQPIILNTEDLKMLVRKVVWRAAATQPKLFQKEALRRQSKSGAEFGGEDGAKEDRGAGYDDEDSEPTVDYEQQDLNVDKEDLAARLTKIKREIERDKKDAALSDLEDLYDLIDEL